MVKLLNLLIRFLFYMLQNLLRALEKSRTDARDSSQNAITEAGLRAKLSMMTTKRDEALGQAEENRRKATLLQEELHDMKIKLSRVSQEKLKMERDQRATMSLAKSLDSHMSSDVEYYKRKVSELNGHIQGMNAVVTEKNRQIDNMRHQIERNISQHRCLLIIILYRSCWEEEFLSLQITPITSVVTTFSLTKPSSSSMLPVES
jgi:wobble nucleotide-excising tRNase